MRKAKNLHQLFEERQKALAAREASWSCRFADRITRISGSMGFLWFHVIWFALWLAANSHWVTDRPFDPYPFGLLTLVVSLEAIVLSTIVLISQNQIQDEADQRAELDLHVNLLAEREDTAILRKLVRIEEHLGIAVGDDERKSVEEQIKEQFSPAEPRPSPTAGSSSRKETKR